MMLIEMMNGAWTAALDATGPVTQLSTNNMQKV